MILFDRRVALTLAKPVDGSYSAQQPNATVVTDLRVMFSIEKKLTSSPNTCTATVYNMNEASRAELQRKPVHVTIDAGYADNIERIFRGDLTYAESTKDGVDWATKLQLGDADRAIKHARVNRSYKGGTNLKTLVGDAAAAMGMKIPTGLSDISGIGAQFASGTTLSGTAAKELTRNLSPRGLGWSVQDGQLQILGGSDTRKDEAWLVSQDTGLIGVPEFGSPIDKGKAPTLSFRMLLTPGLTPGGRVQMASASLKGTFKVLSVTHTGDTHGDDWFTEVEAKPL